jgi:putative ABC transport system permease protein
LAPHKPIPPALAQKLLVAFLRDNLTEEVLGDLDEKFYSALKSRSPWKAKVGYWYQVINYLRPFALRKSKSVPSNLYVMYKSYFKSGWRNLIKNKGYSLINISRLAIGLACCILIGLYTWVA